MARKPPPAWRIWLAIALCVIAVGVGMLAVGHVEQRSPLERFLEEKVRRHGGVMRQRESAGGDTYEGRAAESYAWVSRQLQQAERAGGRLWSPLASDANHDAAWPTIEPIVHALRVAVHLRDIDALGDELPWIPFLWLLDAAKRRAASREDWSEWVAIELDRVTLAADFGPTWPVHVRDDQLPRLDRDAAASIRASANCSRSRSWWLRGRSCSHGTRIGRSGSGNGGRSSGPPIVGVVPMP